ncbi:MAG: hypothetical protein H6661_07360 [Ardenticatenaceae bacterium]|nr:hypothetical protein [Ardenticatenaceae bacterium]
MAPSAFACSVMCIWNREPTCWGNRVFPDLAWGGEQKIWADDPTSGEVRFIAPGAGAWIRPSFGRKNTFTYMFTIADAQNVRLGAGIRGNYAIVNDGWFLDDWKLRRAEG